MKKAKKQFKSSDDEDETIEISTKDITSSKPKAKGLNYAAIGIMLLMGLPILLTVILKVMDYFYPTNPMDLRFRDRLTQCYEVANRGKLNTIDSTLKRYKGKEHVLFHKLKEKYTKVPECQF